MQEIQISADELVAALLNLSEKEQICLLDSCGVSHLGSHLLLAGIKPLETHEITNDNYNSTLEFFDKKLEKEKTFAFFTLSYELGLKINRIKPCKRELSDFAEPDLFLALFDCLIIHDYDTKKTYLAGNKKRFDEIKNLLFDSADSEIFRSPENFAVSTVKSNFTKIEYLAKIEEIKEFIRCGDTYQTNLTQQIIAELPENLSPQRIFCNLRKNNPAPFAAFLKRADSFVISSSPERFFKIQNSKSQAQSSIISTSPIKGTRPRGKTVKEDEKLKTDLLNSEKDRAENVMIVDLLRNDLGRICEFGSISVEKLCDLEEHPTLFHLVSTVKGKLRENLKFSDILKAVFPCGSITGAPKIATMRIIERLETSNRGLSMGAIGFCSGKRKAESGKFENNAFHFPLSAFQSVDLSVAIRTMVVRENRAIFNVGGGIVIDSNPEDEFEETLLKAEALLNSINGKF